MRLRHRPGSGSSSGSTFSASVPRPVGASHSSQARPSAISASTLPSATARVQAIGAGSAAGGGGGAVGAAFIAGYDASNEAHDPDQVDAARAAARPGPDPAELAVARHLAHVARAVSRRPARPDGEQPDLHDPDLAGAV